MYAAPGRSRGPSLHPLPIAPAWPSTRWVGRVTGLVIVVCVARTVWLLAGAWTWPTTW